ncbi:hypothetical protein [Halorhabdus tiamatea]|uniref:hypothetical protein n=1 Tax=Halorhabdus tiamatea TaxID=430914 RepID=UPI0002121079|nr:hypothetical protein [Halorhabdus tiamatea]
MGHPTEAATADSTALPIASASGVDRRPERPDRLGGEPAFLRWPTTRAATWATSARRRRDDRVDVHPSAAGSVRAAERSVIA